MIEWKERKSERNPTICYVIRMDPIEIVTISHIVTCTRLLFLDRIFYAERFVKTMNYFHTTCHCNGKRKKKIVESDEKQINSVSILMYIICFSFAK